MLGGESSIDIPFWDWSSEKHRMYPFQEHVYGALDGNATLIGNFANWTIVCHDSLQDTSRICDPSQLKNHIIRFRKPEVYTANYTRWPRREEICQALSILVYDSAPYNPDAEAKKSFRNFMEGFYIGNESCNKNLFDCTTQTSRLQLHNEVRDAYHMHEST